MKNRYCAENRLDRVYPASAQTPAPGSHRHGFTLPELLAAMLFLALVIPVSLQGVLLANRAAVAAERKMTATRLAEQLINERIITDTWRTAAKQGDFGESWPGYRWELVDRAWPVEPAMRQLTVYVYYPVQGQEQFIQLSTLVEDSEETSSTENSQERGSSS